MRGISKRTLALLAGTLLVALLAAGCGDDDTTCKAPTKDCKGKCVDVQTDEANCGDCGKACGTGQICVAGACTCPSGTEDCNGTCTNTGNDPANCGACGNACATGEVCTGGSCKGACPTGQTDCSGSCVDLQSDDANCGACGTTCDTAAGFACQSGTCSCFGANMTDCSGTCVNTSNDKNNCGSCGNACQASEVCNNGNCEGGCPTGLTDCNGSCKDLQSDENNCGACGTTCDTAAGFTCQSGTCSCLTGFTDCSGQCVNLTNDPAHCGACTTACQTGENCSAGQCVGACPTGFTDCNGSCKDLQSDSSNCGACGTVCTGGKTCQAGTCACTTGMTDCSGTCVNTQTDPSHCGNCTTVCPTTAPMCDQGTCKLICGSGQTACGTPPTCTNLQTDSSNCGTCGVTCTGGKSCVSGACTCPTTLPDQCSGVCVDFQTDENNCGTCGTKCAATETCSAGACVSSPIVSVTVTCTATSVALAGSTNCTANGTLQNGSTVPLTTDSKLTWMKAGTSTNPATCTNTGSVSNTAPDQGKYTAPPTTSPTSVGCKADVWAEYVGTSGTLKSNTVVITIVNVQMTGITLLPGTPVVPYLKGAPCDTGSPSELKVQFRIQRNYNNGTSDQVIDGNTAGSTVTISYTMTNTPAAGAITNDTGVYSLPATEPATTVSSTVTATYVVTGTTTVTYTATTTLTLVVNTVTSITIAPDNANIPAGGTIGFKVSAQFGTQNINVTRWTQQGVYTGSPANIGPYFYGWPDTTYTVDAAGVHATDLLGNETWDATNGEVDFTNPTPYDQGTETVTASFCGVGAGSTRTDLATVVIGSGALDSCLVGPENAWGGTTFSCGGTTSCKYPKGVLDEQYKVYGFFSDAPSTPVDITSQVTFSSSNNAVALPDNTTGNKGEVDMVGFGNATITADAGTLKAGLKCTSLVSVVNATVCKLAVEPWYMGALGRRIYKGPTGTSTTYAPDTATADGTGQQPVLPNMNGFSQQFVARAWYHSTTVTADICKAGTDGDWILIDVTSMASWSTTPGTTGHPAVSATATKGLYNVVVDSGTYETRTDTVKAAIPTYEGSPTNKEDTLQIAVCGKTYAPTPSLTVTSTQLSPSALPTGPALSRPVGEENNYYLTSRFVPTSGTCPFVGAGGLAAANYYLDITEDGLWSPQDPTIATVSNVAGEKGTVKGLKSNCTGTPPTCTTKIRGGFDGAIAELDYTVTSLAVVTCYFSPATTTMNVYTVGGNDVAPGDTKQYTVTGVMSDGSEVSQTANATFNTASGTVASFSTTIKGLLSANTAGTTTATASVGTVNCTTVKNGTDTTADVTVTAANPTSIFIQLPTKTCYDPPAANFTMATGTTMDLYACLVYANGVKVPVDRESGNDDLDWTNNSPQVLGPVTAPFSDLGRFTAGNPVAAPNPGTITATWDLATGTDPTDTIQVTVNNTVLTGITMTGPNFVTSGPCKTINSANNACVPEGTGSNATPPVMTGYFHQYYTVTANTGQDVTSQVVLERCSSLTDTACTTAEAAVLRFTQPVDNGGMAQVSYGGAGSPGTAVFLRASLTQGTSATIHTPVYRVWIIDTDPNVMTLAPATATLTGAGKTQRLTSSVNVPYNSGALIVPVDVSGNLSALAGNNNSALFIDAFDDVAISRAVPSSTAVTVTGTFSKATTAVNGVSTITVAP